MAQTRRILAEVVALRERILQLGEVERVGGYWRLRTRLDLDWRGHPAWAMNKPARHRPGFDGVLRPTPP